MKWVEEVQPNGSENDGLDITKHLFQVHGADANCRTVLKKRLRRNQQRDFFGSVPICVVAMKQREALTIGLG
jgi:hypothetical protein